MSQNVGVDSSGFETMDTSDIKVKTCEMEFTDEMGSGNKATPPPTERQINMAANAALNPNSSATGRGASSQFNIVGGVIGQAVIGSKGPVTFNQQNKVFKKGANNSDYHISGGNFSQANIGGQSVYNNKGSSVSAGNGSFGGLTPEDLAILILEKGVTADEFRQLLEKNYSLSRIAFSIPENSGLKNRMIRALLNTA